MGFACGTQQRQIQGGVGGARPPFQDMNFFQDMVAMLKLFLKHVLLMKFSNIVIYIMKSIVKLFLIFYPLQQMLL